MFNYYDLARVAKRLRSTISAGLHIELRPWHIDLFLIVGLLFLNPIFYGMRVPLNLSPDAVGYLSFAESVVTGVLYLSSWGHIDTAVILPPVYPLLIALLDSIYPYAVSNALAINIASMLFLSVVIYFYVRRFAPSLVAAVAVLLIQLNFYYVYFANSLLTEALFLLIVVLSLFLTARLTTSTRPTTWQLLSIGLLAALAFLVRQVGLLLGVFLLFWFVADAIRRSKNTRLINFRLPVFFLIGWAVLVGPYGVVLYAQTGETIFSQFFRMQTYVVTTSDTSVLEKIATLERADGVSYVTVYKNRRQLRELLPDSSEMLAYVVPAAEVRARSAQEQNSSELTRFVTRFIRNVASNLSYFTDNHGKLLLGLVLLTSLTPLFVRVKSTPWWPRLILPGFLLTYVLAVSMLTGSIARYFSVLFPLAIAQIAIELGIVFYWCREHKLDPRFMQAGIPLTFALLMLFAPRTVLNAPPPISTINDRPVTKLSILEGDPAFALLPVYPYLAGGTFRILPNDTLERVARYAHLTGVRWLLVPRQSERILDTQFYSNAGWLRDAEALMKRTDLLRFCCTVSMMSVVEEHLLFEILPVPHRQ